MEINSSVKEQIDSIRQKCEVIKPVVMTPCITYNHGAYIRDALEGFVSQKTNFPFVAIIHDDASTDGTKEIIEEYAKKYPDIVLPVYEPENLYSKHDGTFSKTIRDIYEAVGAKYIAMCEGDDYWTDPLKLQTQVDFLDEHPDCSMCFHSVNVIKESGSKEDINVFNHLKEKYYNINEIIARWTIPTCSVIYRYEYAAKIPKNKNFQYGDNVLWSTLFRYGKGYCLNKKMGTYRRHPGGWTAQGSYKSNTKQIIHFEALFKEFPEIEKETMDDKLIFYYSLAFTTGVRELKLKSLKYFFQGLRKYKMKYIKELCRSISQYIKKISK